jgi:hypothetical protein
MSERSGPPPNWRGWLVQAGFALGGAAIIGFVFVPALSPATDPVTAFFGALVFMALTIAAARAARRS